MRIKHHHSYYVSRFTASSNHSHSFPHPSFHLCLVLFCSFSPTLVALPTLSPHCVLPCRVRASYPFRILESSGQLPQTLIRARTPVNTPERTVQFLVVSRSLPAPGGLFAFEMSNGICTLIRTQALRTLAVSRGQRGFTLHFGQLESQATNCFWLVRSSAISSDVTSVTGHKGNSI